jgi:hypothetical protein
LRTALRPGDRTAMDGAGLFEDYPGFQPLLAKESHGKPNR